MATWGGQTPKPSRAWGTVSRPYRICLRVSCQFVGSCKRWYQVMATQVVCQAHKVAPFEAPGECRDTQSHYSEEESWWFLLCVISSATERILVATYCNRTIIDFGVGVMPSALMSGGPGLKRTQVYPKKFGERIHQLHKILMDCVSSISVWNFGLCGP